MTPSELLFEKPFGKNNQALFGSQTDLVKEITKHDKSAWKDKNFNSVRAFVNQVINGERKLSEKLRAAIFLVLPPHIDNDNDLAFLEEKIQTIFSEHFEAKKQLKKQPIAKNGANQNNHFIEADDFFLLEKRGLLADNILITTRKPGIIDNHKLGNEIRIQLLQKVGVLESSHKPANYIFFFPQPNGFDDFAFRFWQELYSYLKYELKMSDAEKQLTVINQEKKIQTFIAPDIICSYPIILYDLNSRAEVAFTVFDYLDKGVEKVSTARISPSFIKWWKNAIYNPYLLKSNNSKYPVQEILFKNIVADIHKNEGLF